MIPKSNPTPNAIERDWTNETLVLDIENSIGEQYHFEILPGENPNNIPNVKSAKSAEQEKGCSVLITIPIATSDT